MRSQVTTKRGDQGRAVTISGDEYAKSHPVFECCGDLDTLRAETALRRFDVLQSGRDDAQELGAFLFWLLHVYFLVGSQCNDPGNKRPEYRKEDVGPKHLARLESMQARLEAGIRLPKAFIVSASNDLAARIDLLCTTARRFERSVVRLKEAVPEFGADDILAFANRLSDFLYVLARHLENGEHTALDYSVLKDEEG